MATQRCPHFNPRSCEQLPYMVKKTSQTGSGQGSLDGGVILDYLSGPSVTTDGLCKKQRKAGESEKM